MLLLFFYEARQNFRIDSDLRHRILTSAEKHRFHPSIIIKGRYFLSGGSHVVTPYFSMGSVLVVYSNTLPNCNSKLQNSVHLALFLRDSCQRYASMLCLSWISQRRLTVSKLDDVQWKESIRKVELENFS